jgi:integrase
LQTDEIKWRGEHGSFGLITGSPRCFGNRLRRHALGHGLHLEVERGNSVATRNARLAALRSFLKYVAHHDLTVIGVIEQALSVPMKRFEKPMLGFLTREEMRAILEARPVEAAKYQALKADGAAAVADQAAGARMAGEPQPNLIADLTSKRGRTPQKRLEQMTDYDEEQAAAILKQWMRGAKSA